MIVALCTTADLTGNLILNALLPRLGGVRARVFLATRKRATDEAVPSLATAWTLERTVPLEAVFPAAERAFPEGGGDLLTFRQLERRLDAPMRTLASAADWDGGRPVAACRPDLVVSARFGFLFPGDFIDARPGRVFNLHPSALPAHPGQYPVLRALAAGEREIGCTLHHVVPAADAGDVVGVRRVPVAAGRSHFWHRAEAYRAGVELVMELIGAVREGAAVAARPQEGRAPARPFPDEEEIGAAAAMGWPLHRDEEYAGLLRRYLVPPAEAAPTARGAAAAREAAPAR
jgi:methionyl-tRNA formyltransferase